MTEMLGFCFVFKRRWRSKKIQFSFGEDGGLKQKTPVKVEQFSFQTLTIFLFWMSTDRIQIRFNGGLFLKIKGFRILLNQGDQLQIRLIMILQASNGQVHLIVQIGVVL